MNDLSPVRRRTLRALRRALLLYALSGLTSACAHQADVTRASLASEGPPPHVRVAADGIAALTRSQVREPAPDPSSGPEVSLGGMLAFADLRSPVLAVARSTRSRARAAMVAAEVLLPNNPEVSIAVGPRIGGGGTGVDIDASLMQQIQIAGERGLRIAAADRARELTDAEIEQIRWNVHCDVHAAFHRVLLEQARVRLAERVVSFQRDVLQVVERQIAAGETAPLSLRLAQAEVAQAEQVLVAMQQALLKERLRLAQLSGWPVSNPPMPTGTVDAPRDPPALEQLSAVARTYLPSLRAGAARLHSAKARTTLADREAWPRPSIGVQYKHEGNPSSEGAYNIIMGVLSSPIPSFQVNQGERAQARAEAVVAEAELDAARRVLDGEVTEARSDVVAAAARTRAYGAEILPRFEENLTLLRRSFELGEIDILALSTGRERFLRIQSDALLAQQDYFVALAGLERVVGVDLWRDDHQTGSSPP